ncbi:hypothetical protein [Priestia megaterium]
MNKKLVIYVIVCLSSFLVIFNSAFAQSKKIPNKECQERYYDKVIHDVKSSFPELKALDNTNDYVQEYTHSDLDEAMMATGGHASPYTDTVSHLFEGSFSGFPRFFVAQSDNVVENDKYDSNYVGYFLYKETDGTDVMIKMRPGKAGWDIVDKKEKKGKITPYKCEE